MVQITSVWVRSAAVGLVSACVLTTGAPQQVAHAQTPVFRTGITVVPLDVRVVDRKGNSVNDLTRGDFVVLEDGVPQEITHFERHVLTPGTPGPVPTRSTAAPFALEIQNRRIFYIELSRLWLGNAQFGLVGALTKFLRERLLPQDYAVVSIFGRITDLTTDHHALAQVVERVAALHDAVGRSAVLRNALYDWRSLPADSHIRRAFDEAFAPASSGLQLSLTPAAEFSKLLGEIVSHYITAQGPGPGGGVGAERALRIRREAETIQTDVLLLLGALQYLRFIDGEKHLVYFPGGPQTGLALGAVEDDREIAKVATDARVALHMISRTNGLPIGHLNLVPDMVAKNITKWTGGSVFINRWPDESLARIDEVTRGGYVLAYSPIKSVADERYRKITVRVKRPDGATVMVRDSYLSTEKPPAYDPVTYTAKQHMLTVAAFPGGVDDLGVTVAAKSPSPATLLADVAIDVGRVQFTTDGDRHVAKLELAVLCSDARDHLVGQRWVTLDLKLTDATWTKALAAGLEQSIRVSMTARARYVKAVVYDYGTSRAGAAVVEVK